VSGSGAFDFPLSSHQPRIGDGRYRRTNPLPSPRSLAGRQQIFLVCTSISRKFSVWMFCILYIPPFNLPSSKMEDGSLIERKVIVVGTGMAVWGTGVSHTSTRQSKVVMSGGNYHHPCQLCKSISSEGAPRSVNSRFFAAPGCLSLRCGERQVQKEVVPPVLRY
jgi:hypothetical protein